MKIKHLIVMIGCMGLLHGCCVSPIQGNTDIGVSSSSCGGGGCGGTYTASSCGSGGCGGTYTESSCSGGGCGGTCTSSRNVLSYCGDPCNPNGCSSFFGNVGGLNYDDPGSM